MYVHVTYVCTYVSTYVRTNGRAGVTLNAPAIFMAGGIKIWHNNNV